MNIKRTTLITLIIMSLLIAVGCGDRETAENVQSSVMTTETAYTTENTAANVSQESPKHNIVKTMSGESDYAELAHSLDELINASDIIAEAEVAETSSYVPDDSIMIYTSLKLENVKCFKGEYDGSALDVDGGYMKLKDYKGSKGVHEVMGDVNSENALSARLTDEEPEQEIYYNCDNIYTPEAGDRILFFGQKNDNGKYYITYSYQGLFVLKDNVWQNQALQLEHLNFTEPLVKDIIKKIASTKVISGVKNTVNSRDKVIGIPERDFTDKLVELMK